MKAAQFVVGALIGVSALSVVVATTTIGAVWLHLFLACGATGQWAAIGAAAVAGGCWMAAKDLSPWLPCWKDHA